MRVHTYMQKRKQKQTMRRSKKAQERYPLQAFACAVFISLFLNKFCKISYSDLRSSATFTAGPDSPNRSMPTNHHRPLQTVSIPCFLPLRVTITREAPR